MRFFSGDEEPRTNIAAHVLEITFLGLDIQDNGIGFDVFTITLRVMEILARSEDIRGAVEGNGVRLDAHIQISGNYRPTVAGMRDEITVSLKLVGLNDDFLRVLLCPENKENGHGRSV